LEQGFKTDREFVTALERKALEGALQGEESGAVKLKCQECGKEWFRPAGSWEQCE
jgi:hypothetical protein